MRWQARDRRRIARDGEAANLLESDILYIRNDGVRGGRRFLTSVGAPGGSLCLARVFQLAGRGILIKVGCVFRASSGHGPLLAPVAKAAWPQVQRQHGLRRCVPKRGTILGAAILFGIVGHRPQA